MKDQNFNYIEDLTKYQRQKTSLVKILGVSLGDGNPIRIQSMTDTDTSDTEATVEQIIRIIKSGADLVRVTVRGVPDAENLQNIKRELVARGFENPLVADIHFNPHLAEIAAKYVFKVRINPGNFYDKRAKFEHHLYTNDEYKAELRKIEEHFVPFLKILKDTNTALRIGANQGSLSDRIMSRYPPELLNQLWSFCEFAKNRNFIMW